MNDKKIRRMVISALMAALVCVATMVVRIPTPTNGYVNLGDCFVLLCGWLLGPWYGGAAAGIGSMLTDLFAGYTSYVPGTFLIKGLDALVAALIFHALGRNTVAAIVSGVVGELIMVGGYFVYEALFLQYGVGAAVSIPGNLVQGAVGLVIGVVLLKIFQKARIAEKF